MEVTKEDVIANLRAIIISSKGGLKLSDVRADYYETFGVDIPLKTVGCSSLEEFFKKNSQNFTVIGNCVSAVTKSSSFHIVSLVNRQRTSKKRGRSKLCSKQVRNLYRTPKPLNASTVHVKKAHYPSGATKQTNIKDNTLNTFKQVQQSQQMAASKKKTQNNQLSNKAKEEKSCQIQNHMKNVDDLKGITRTVINDCISSAKESVLTLNSDNSENSKSEDKNIDLKNSIPFDNFEDLHISKIPEFEMLNSKESMNRKTLLNNSNCNESLKKDYSVESLPSSSPFQRSLVNNSQEEILSAKKFAHTCLKNNNYLNLTKDEKISMTFDLEDDSKYERKLKEYCLKKGLVMPNYSVIIREQKNQSKSYECKLSISDSFCISSYPIETCNEVTARELASKKAYNQLILSNNLPMAFYETKYVIKLRELCSQKNLPEPIFKSLECHPKNEPKYFICKVRIGDNILLSSYPVEVQNEFSARDLAAKKAYDHLLSDSKSLIRISKNETEILSQIFNIIKSKEYGVWSNKMPILYMEEYNEELQSNWFDLVKTCPKFEITSIERVGYIIRATSGINSFVDEEDLPALTPLKVPESNQWEVYVTNVVTSAEIWCRLIGKNYSEVYDTMMTKLELEPPTINVLKPVVGEIYLVDLEESWNRVKVTEIYLEKQEAFVFLIDIGVDEVVKISQLFYLQKTFFSIPPQALLFSLNELDCLAECEELQSNLFHSLLGNTFIAEIVAILDEGGNVSSVNLWDTSTEEDININLKLLDDLIKTIGSPSLPTVGLVKDMFVSYIDDAGNVYLQTSKQNIQFVDHIISVKIKNSEKLVSANSKADLKKLYVTRSNKNGLFYRAKISKFVEEGTVLVKFIDYGYEQLTAVQDLFDLEETSLDLATIPSQVIKVKFAKLKVINQKVLAKIRENILEQSVLVKVIQISPKESPYVEIFKRSQSDGTLSSINNKIVNDKELCTADTPVRKKSFVVGLENTLSKNLPMPNIPQIGNFFNVFVTLAANPGLFIIQPLSTKSELMELMFGLQKKCDASFSEPINQEDFKIGELFAVKYADDFWYRAYAHAIISSSAFSVYLCDFGDFIMVPAEKLMPLPSEFKTFPYQAIRAYLAGMKPINKDWSAEDCVKFRELVVEKTFVSQVVEINRDVKNPNYISLGLILVDTSTSEDIYIHQLLLDKKMAVLKS